VRVRVEERTGDAGVVRDADGRLALSVAKGVLTPRAFVALIVALEHLEESCQHLHRTG